MSQSPVVCPRNPLPRELDVAVSISRPQTEIATDMTLMCFLTPDCDVPPDNRRVRLYSTFSALAADTAAGSAMYLAGQAFFGRSERPRSMAVARVCEAPIPATLMSGGLSLSSLSEISNGGFALEVNGDLVEVSGLDFTRAATEEAVIGVLQSRLPDGLNASRQYGSLCVFTSVAGDGASISFAETPTQPGPVEPGPGEEPEETETPEPGGEPEANGESGEDGEPEDSGGSGAGGEPVEPAFVEDVSSLLGLTQARGATRWQGYTPTGLAGEAELARNAARCAGNLPYAFTIDARYRDTDEQKAMADWAEGHVAWFSACTNSAAACNTADASNIGWHAYDKGCKRTSTIYHDNPQAYPDVSYAALALATDYSLPDSAITMKFKQLDGIEPTTLTETELAALNSRRINCYVAIGNSSRTVREGVQGLDTWYTDSLVNLDNFREELQVEVYNVFLRNKKVPYTSAGQDKLVSAAAKINRKYTRNGVFADRDVESDSVESGITTLPATNIIPTPVAFATTSERAARLAPPILIEAYEAGAFHKINVNVSVYS